MPVFIWEGRVGDEIQKGEMEAPSKYAVIVRLRRMHIRPIPDTIKIKKSSFLQFKFEIGGRIQNKDIVVFTRQLSTMIDSGLSIVNSLDILANQQPNKRFKRVVISVKQEIEGGSNFAEALDKHPDVFSSLYVNLVRSGEVGGALNSILERLADYMEKSESIKRKIKGATVYPAIVITVAVSVLTIVLVFVVPVFAEMFKDMGTTLPALTQLIVDMSNFMRDNIIPITIVVVATWLLITTIHKRSLKVRKAIDAFILKIAFVGTLVQKIAIARFCRTLATLTAGGISIMDGLEVASKTSGNLVIEEVILDAREAVSKGLTIAEPLLKSPKVFPPMVSQMVRVGEETGALDKMLDKIADFYEDEVDTAVSGLIAAMEPIMIVFLGGTVGIIVVAMYLPMFKLISTLGA